MIIPIASPGDLPGGSETIYDAVELPDQEILGDAPQEGRRVEVERTACNFDLAFSLRLGDGEIAIGAVRAHRLTGFKMELGAIDLYRDDVRLERHQVGYPADPGIGLTIRPCRSRRVTDVVVATQPVVPAERLVLHRGQRGLIHVGARNVPARRETGLVEDYGSLCISDDALTMAHYEATRGLAD